MSDKTGIATFIRCLNDWRGDARLYKVEPSYEGNDHLIVSGAVVIDHPVIALASIFGANPARESETFIFPASADGEAISMMEMKGSISGEINHAKALANAGYAIAEVPA